MPLNPRPGNPFQYFPLPKLGFPSVLFLSGFPQHNPVHKIPLSDTCYMTRPIHSSDLINRTIFGDEYWSKISSPYSLLHSCLTSSLLDPNILLSTLFTNILSLHSSHNEERRNCTPIQTTGKYKILNIFNYIFLERKAGRKNSSRNDRNLLWHQSALNIFLRGIFIFLERSKLFELFHSFEEKIIILYIETSPLNLISRLDPIRRLNSIHFYSILLTSKRKSFSVFSIVIIFF